MYKYVKHLSYPVNVTKKDLKMAKLIITQVGGYAGELGATLRYFSQKYTMPDEKGRALLNDIATEEIGHLELVDTIVSQLMENATLEEIKEAGLEFPWLVKLNKHMNLPLFRKEEDLYNYWDENFGDNLKIISK